MNHAIEVTDLRRAFGKKQVLDGVSFSVGRGEIVALLGANGAGKTTTLACIEGVLRADAGSIHVNGKTGVQLQNGALPKSMRPMEAVQLFCRWHGTSRNALPLDKLEIPSFSRTAYGALSTGQKRRLHLALALCARPDILILDEPTAGLDVDGQLVVAQMMEDFRSTGGSILLASHDLAEMERTADRALILRNGRIAWEGAPGALATNERGEAHLIAQTSRGTKSIWANSLSCALSALLQQCEAEGAEVLDVHTEHTSLLTEFLRTEEEETA